MILHPSYPLYGIIDSDILKQHLQLSHNFRSHMIMMKVFILHYPLLGMQLTSGCGLSRKINNKTNSTFLYYWYYQDKKKHEKYLGRADDKTAEIRGAQMMLEFYRNQDEELHKTINKLETLTTTTSSSATISPLIQDSSIKKKPDYLPEMED